jgi:hypothetical protein
MTRRDLTARILRELNDDPATPTYWDAAEIHDYLDEGHEIIAEATHVVVRTFLIPRRTGVQVYQLPGIGTDILAPYRVWLPDLHRRLEAHTLVDLDTRHQRWLEVSGEPWWWYPISWDQFGIWPSPQTGTGWLEVNCYCWPSPLADDAQAPEWRETTHQALTTYGTWLGYLKQWDAQRAGTALANFLGSVGAIRDQAGVQQLRVEGGRQERGDNAYGRP